MDAAKLEERLNAFLATDREYILQKQENAKKLINEIMAITDAPEAIERIYKKYQLYIHPQDMPELVLRKISAKGWDFNHSSSFRSLIATDSFRRKTTSTYTAWPLNNKEKSLKFVNKFSVETPTVFQQKMTLNNLNVEQYPSIIKPLYASTSHGVFIALSPTKFREVKSAKEVASISDVKASLLKSLQSKTVAKDEWKVEELIADVKGEQVRPARDLKFYCFYGKVGMILECDREFGAKYRIRNPDGSVGSGGEFVESDDFPLTPITDEDVATVEKISREIPVPFVSIDFLKTEDRLVFCEFTPRPGFAFKYKAEFDAYLGSLYLDAEARLHKDLVNGRNFELYLDYCKQVKALRK